MVGEVIDHYKILERIGEGGMGTVYRAIDTMLEREVALKLLRTDLPDDPDVIRRFRAEAVALARLSHPHIATLFGLVRRDAQLCMVMELVRGETLATLMKVEPAFPVERAVRLAMQILAALEYAHDSGVVHRDVKPSNVIVAPTGVAKVLDFGIARVLDSDRMTRYGLIVGTPQYMAPEQIRGDQVDGRADVYAVGVLTYEMMAGRLPFKADTGVGLLYAHLEGTATPLAEAAPHVPQWLTDVVHRAMAKSAADRYRAGELRRALDEGLSSGIVARPNAPTSALSVAAASVPPPSRQERTSGVETAPQPTDLQATVLRGHASPAPSLLAPSGSVDVFRHPSTHFQPLAPQVPETAPARTWIVAGVLSLAVLAAGATWVLWSGAGPEPSPSAGASLAAGAASPTGSASRDSGTDTARASGQPTGSTPTPGATGRIRSEPGAAGIPATMPAKTTAESKAPAATLPTEGPSASAERDRDAAPTRPTTAEPSRPVEPSMAVTAEKSSAPASALAPVTFDDIVLLVPSDRGHEEVEVRVTFHSERFVVFDVDAGRITSQVFYRRTPDRPSATVMLGTPRFLTGSERWFVLPTSVGEIVLRLDLDSSGEIVDAFEARSGIRVLRRTGEFGE